MLPNCVIAQLGLYQGGPQSTIDGILASYPVALGSIPGIPEIFSEKFFREKIVEVAEVAKVYRQCCYLDQWTAEA